MKLHFFNYTLLLVTFSSLLFSENSLTNDPIWGSRITLRSNNRFADFIKPNYSLEFSAQLELQKKINDSIKAGLRLSTTTQDPAHPFVSLPERFNRSPVGIDRAYFLLNPDPFDFVHVTFGQFKSGFETTPIFWDSDIQPTGAMEQIKWESEKYKLYMNLGQFFYNSNKNPSDQKYAALLGYQLGSEFKASPLFSLEMSSSFYDFSRPSFSLDYTVPSNPISKGNTLNGNQLANAYQLIDLIMTLHFHTSSPITFTAEYIGNTRPSKNNNGAYAQFKIGKSFPEPLTFIYEFGYIESDSMLSALMDNTLSYKGNTSGIQGHRLSFDFKLMNHTVFSLTGAVTQESGGKGDPEVRLLADMSVYF